VTNRVEGHGSNTNKRRAAKRLAVQQAAAERAAARRRKLLAISGAAAAGVIVLATVIVMTYNGSKGHQAAPASSASAQASSSASAAAFPPLPPGADPALATKPKVAAGTGSLTKLTVTPLVEGRGEATRAGQTIAVNYVGVSFTTGKEFDSSWSRSQPFSFAVGQGRVIPGWDQGLVGVKIGSRVQLDIPSNLAYGDQASGGAPSGPLRFVVDVLSAQ
jgi:peptidylprolyl isomerase